MNVSYLSKTSAAVTLDVMFSGCVEVDLADSKVQCGVIEGSDEKADEDQLRTRHPET